MVVANSDKSDLERFYIDLPKYFPYLSEGACDDWKSFKESNPVKLATEDITWELPSLLSAAILSSQSHSNLRNPISSETLKLLEKEVAPPKPVSILYYVAYTHEVLHSYLLL